MKQLRSSGPGVALPGRRSRCTCCPTSVLVVVLAMLAVPSTLLGQPRTGDGPAAPTFFSFIPGAAPALEKIGPDLDARATLFEVLDQVKQADPRFAGKLEKRERKMDGAKHGFPVTVLVQGQLPSGEKVRVRKEQSIVTLPPGSPVDQVVIGPETAAALVPDIDLAFPRLPVGAGGAREFHTIDCPAVSGPDGKSRDLVVSVGGRNLRVTQIVKGVPFGTVSLLHHSETPLEPGGRLGAPNGSKHVTWQLDRLRIDNVPEAGRSRGFLRWFRRQ